MARRIIAVALRWTMGCRRGNEATVRWMVFAIILFCITYFLLLLIPSSMKKTRRPVVNTNDGRASVLLFSYYRSGSSLLGSMFNLNPNAFYWFEPLAAPTIKWGWVGDVIPPRNFYHHDNGSEKSIPVDTLRNTLSTPLSLIFDCNLTSLPPIHFVSPISRWLTWMPAFADFNRCVSRSNKASRGDRVVFGKVNHWWGFQNCLHLLVNRCRRSSIVAVKTIRLKMGLVEEMMERDAALRLVYMVRDPRGMLNSWWTSTDIAVKVFKHRYGRQDYEADARIMCKRMLSDWRTFVQLRDRYHDRCLQFSYEELAESPQDVVQLIYRFLGFEEPPVEVLRGIEEMTSANKSDGVFGVHRKNSSVTSQKWKTRLSPELRRIVTNNCHELLQEVGYQ